MAKSLIAGMLLALALVGCSSPAPDTKTSEGTTGSSASTAKKYTIAVIPKGTTHVYWKAVEAGAKKAGEDLGVDIIWKGPLKEDNKDEQIKVVEDFITRKVDGIALAPLDANALRVPVKEAQDAGIDVDIFDSDLADVTTTSFVATDNKAAGAMDGQKLGELLGGKGKVIMMRYVEGSASTANREEGFLEAIKKFPGIEVVSDNQYGGATVESAQATAETLINRFKTGDKFSVDGIFCPNESSTFGMLRALQEAGLAGKVKFVGFDSSQPLIEALKAGTIDALVVQNPNKMGYLAVETLVKHLKGETVEARIDTGATVVTKDNMEEPDVAALIK